MRASPSITISIIAYNEEATIAPLVQECSQLLHTLTADHEILVVDDGSVDRTPQILLSLKETATNLTVIEHSRNMGFGPTLRDAFHRPAKDLIFLLPGDGQIPPGEIERLLPFIENNDLVLGWRNQRQDSSLRHFLSWGYNAVISLLLGRRVHDVDSVVLVRRESFRRLTLNADSAFIHAEIFLRASSQHLHWVEVPIAHRSRQSGKSGAFRVSIMRKALWDMVLYLVRFGR